VIAIDDLAIYVDGQFDLPLSDEIRPWCPAERNIGFASYQALKLTRRAF